MEESYECHETIEPPFKYIEANSETGCFLHYFGRGVELSIATSVDRQIVRWGKHHGGEAVDRGLRQHIDSGDWLWGISYGLWSSPSSLRLSPACLGDGLP